MCEEFIMLKIGVFSKVSRIRIRILRHHGKVRLLVPKSIDLFTNSPNMAGMSF